MMKQNHNKIRTSFLFLSLIVLLSINVLGQKSTITLTFTAVDNGQYIPLDSILIKNVTQSSDTTLYAPDTVLTLNYIVNIDENRAVYESTFSISQNYPNPFKGKTYVDLFVQKKQNIEITVCDMLGRKLAYYENIFNNGNHILTFSAGSGKYYLLTITGEYSSKSIKMLNSSIINSSSKNCKLEYFETRENPSRYKSQNSLTGFIFDLGDELELSGFATTYFGTIGNNNIIDAPQENTTYEFNIIKGIRCSGIPTVTDLDGNTYNTIQIGTQCWLAENLKTTTYQNGTAIPNVTDENAWEDLETGAYVWYDNDITWKDLYGALYNWYAVDNTNGLCPTGWHIPSTLEWIELGNFIGGFTSPNGDKLKSCRHTNTPLDGYCETYDQPRWFGGFSGIYGTDDYGFSWLPSGFRNTYGNFFSMGTHTMIWSSTAVTGASAWRYYLRYDNSGIDMDGSTKRSGYSVRCIRDITF